MYTRLLHVMGLLLLFPLLATSSPAAERAVTLDDGNLRMFISNDGIFAWDTLSDVGQYGGLYYPKNTLRPMTSAAGIWISGKRSGEWYSTYAGHGSEFAAGPVGYGDTAALQFPVYRITRSATQQFEPDYKNWPRQYGAPLNELSQPLIRGSQAAFAIFNDLDSARHIYSHTGTPPLGVEVTLYAYTFDNDYQLFDTLLFQVIFLDYSITNVTNRRIDSCVVTLMLDTDIGAGHNDRIGCDSALAVGYCYNDNGYDSEFGHSPPTVGAMLMGNELNSFNYYHSRSRLDALEETINLVRGVSIEGGSYIDPTTGLATRFPFSGNPVSDSGWVNDESRDYRILLNSVAEPLEPGASRELRFAVLLTQGGDVPDGIAEFLQLAAMVRELEGRDDLEPSLQYFHESPFEFTGSPLNGRDWGGRFLSGGLDYAARYFDGVEREVANRLELTFYNHPVQKIYRYCRVGDRYVFKDFQRQPLKLLNRTSGSLNECAFIDSDCDGTLTDANGFLDPLILLSSPAGSRGRAELIQPDAPLIAESVFLVLELDNTLQQAAGKGIMIYGEKLAGLPLELDGDIIIDNAVAGFSLERTMIAHNPTLFVQEMNLVSDHPLEVTVTPSQFVLGAGESKALFMKVAPADSGRFESSLLVHSYGYKDIRHDYAVQISADDLVRIGDANNDDRFDLNDILLLLRILYRNEQPQVPERWLDADCNGIVNLSDLIVLLNSLFHGWEISCPAGE